MKSRTMIFFILLTNFVYGQGYLFDTLLINNQKTFQIKTKAISGDLVMLTSTLGTKIYVIDTIDSGGLANINFPDFDKDGNADILVSYMGNNSTYFLYLFDTTTNKFIEIEDFSNFPEAIQLKSNPKFYYSYHRAGCADMNWVSDFFKIQDFKAIQLGHIHGQGCDYKVEENPQVIEIYKVPKNDEKKGVLIEKLPYLKFVPEFGDKWYFIEKYWNKNYAKFK